MAPSVEEADAHQALISKLDIYSVHKPFRNSNWKPTLRRNKNIKNILGEAVRKEASLLANLEDGITVPPQTDGSTRAGTASNESTQEPSISQTSRNPSKLVSEKSSRSNGLSSGPNLTYTNIESAPSLAHSKHYCDITGLPAPYTDPKTRLRYHNKEIFGTIRSLGPGVAEQYLEARGAHTILK
ncbi:BgTH12-04474 [Blumeria graminis f. sp. triticale]|uniref:BgtA-20918 n=3 Tax=Blumeria graminis TaxID=34373 RepID=A0A9X9L7P5_BLUGR|nr:hypothetical protein BGT96224_A20918 [Blumeria graminis f. sp. tritici 96224]CAD6498815.1 BgTH12-04474 [Blumeria graminis f. sp. triticale]VCU38920.1 BgtA-20918 [Blumeria graminis f. sp. tritici]